MNLSSGKHRNIYWCALSDCADTTHLRRSWLFLCRVTRDVVELFLVFQESSATGPFCLILVNLPFWFTKHLMSGGSLIYPVVHSALSTKGWISPPFQVFTYKMHWGSLFCMQTVQLGLAPFFRPRGQNRLRAGLCNLCVQEPIKPIEGDSLKWSVLFFNTSSATQRKSALWPLREASLSLESNFQYQNQFSSSVT